MARKRKRAKQAAGKRAPRKLLKSKLAKKQVKKTRFYSDFERDFRNFLVGYMKAPGDPNKTTWGWPPLGQLPTPSLAEIVQVVNLLGAAYVASTPPAAGADPPVTFLDRVATRVHNYGWPLNPPGKSASHLYEISRVVDTMLEAINRGGGGGSGWPPGR